MSTLIYYCFYYWFLHHQELRFLHFFHPVTLVLTQLSYIHFSSYTARTHLGSYTVVTTSVLTPFFILRFLYCLSFHFTVHTLFVILTYGSYPDVISFGSYTIITTLGSYLNFLANNDLFSIGYYTDDD